MKYKKTSSENGTNVVFESIDSPEKLPNTSDDANAWQQANRRFWEHNPMRYDWNEGISAEQGSKEFFDQIDQRFFNDTKSVMPSTPLLFGFMIAG